MVYIAEYLAFISGNQSGVALARHCMNSAFQSSRGGGKCPPAPACGHPCQQTLAAAAVVDKYK